MTAEDSDQDFPRLLSPLRIGPKQVRNRVLVTAHVPGLAESGVPGEAYAAYHRARARGGVGLQITGATPVHGSSALDRANAILNLDERVIPGYRRLADAVQGEGGMILAQLAHYGATRGAGGAGQSLWSPSDQASELVRVQPHVMTVKEIDEVVLAFGAAAGRAREGGLDGVEILAAFGLLIAAFLSPYSNKRGDGYGGTLENRLRFALEIIDAVRAEAGPGLIVGMRIPGDEFVEGGLDLAQMQEVAQALEATGKLDYLNVIAGTNLDRINRTVHWPPTPAPHGLFVHLAKGIKQVVALPVFTTGRIVDPHHAERILAEGAADMVGMTRAHIADPEIVAKARAGRSDDIRPCVGANLCIAAALKGGPIRCLHNPEAAREKAWGPAVHTKRGRAVAVIGGGPGGLEAACVAAERGHRVKLYEAASVLGGQFLLRAAIPTWAEFQAVIDWRRRRLEQLQVPVELGRRIEAADLASLEAEAVVLATGAEPLSATLPGAAQVPVMSPHAFIAEGAEGAQSALVWDQAGGIVGAGALDAALCRGLLLQVVTPAFAVAEDIDLVQRVPLYERLLSAGTGFHPNCELVALDGGVPVIRNVYSLEESRLAPVDLVIAWTGRRALGDLGTAIEAAGLELHRIGDCVAPRTGDLAIAEAALAARRI